MTRSGNVAVVLELLSIVDRLWNTNDSLSGSLQPYQGSLRASIGALLEILSGSFLELETESDELLKIDFGPEPTAFPEAWKTLPSFISTCRAHIASASLFGRSLAGTEAHVRAMTYAYLITDAFQERVGTASQNGGAEEGGDANREDEGPE